MEEKFEMPEGCEEDMKAKYINSFTDFGGEFNKMEKTSKRKYKGRKEYQIVRVSEEALNFIKEKLSEDILFDYDEENNELFIIKKPESYTEALSGLGSEMWREAGGTEYLEKERDSWED